MKNPITNEDNFKINDGIKELTMPLILIVNSSLILCHSNNMINE